MKFILLLLLISSVSVFGWKKPHEPEYTTLAPTQELEHIPLQMVEDLNKFPGGFFSGIIKKIEEFMSFLCTRCTDIIVKVDQAIDSQELLKTAEKFCLKMVSNKNLQALCSDVTRDVLLEIYKQLKRFEPHPSLCTHLRLCDACSVNITALPERKSPLARTTAEGIPNYFPVFAKIAPMADIFEADLENLI